MAVVRFECVATGRTLETRLTSDEDTLRLFREPGLKTECCFCDGQHRWRMVGYQWIRSDLNVEPTPKGTARFLC